MSNLLVINGPNIGVRYTLASKTTIGRAPESAIQILDPSISRCHCEILKDGPHYRIHDKNSQNGVLVNGKKITEKQLTRDDEVVIGSTTFLFDTDHALKNTLFSNKRVYYSSPADQTLIRLDFQKEVARQKDSDQSRYIERSRDLLCRLADLFSSSHLPLPQAFERILQTLLRFFNAASGCLMIWDTVLEEFVPMVVLSDDDEFAVSQDLIQNALLEKQTLLISAPPPDTQMMKTLRMKPKPQNTSANNAILIVPLIKEEQIKGLLYFKIQNEDQILLYDIQILQSVATLVCAAIEHSKTLDELEREKTQSRPKNAKLVGAAPAFRKVLDLTRRVAPTRSTALLTGETGTGKEMIAREIHRLSKRAKYPFVAINCAAIPETLIESELFGHERGAFTGADRLRRGLIESAHGGTLFLDEIGEMSPSAQTKLLRFLQDHVITRIGGHQPLTVDTRILASTNVDLPKAIQEKRFREDLWYRLKVFEIPLPPLRERPEDISLLAEHFLSFFDPEYNKPIQAISKAAIRILEAYPWPGNIRELQNVVECAILLCDGDTIEPEHLRLSLAPAPALERTDPFLFIQEQDTDPRLAASSLAEAEKHCILKALKATDWNQAQAALLLKIHRNTLRKKITDLGLKA